MGKFIVRLLFVICIFGFNFSYASASNVKLVVSPPATELTLKPGEIAQKTIKITNNDSTPIDLRATISDFIVEDDQGTPIKVSTQASGRYFAAPWFTLSQDRLTILPQETVQLVVIIEAPQDALPGGHYAGVYFSPTTINKLTGTGAEVVPEIGSLFLINIPGDVQYDALISNFTTSQSLFEFGPVDFVATIINRSDTHLSLSPTITVRNMLGKKLDSIELSSTNIFPFTSRTLTGTWDNVWGLGRYSAELTVPYGSNFVVSRILYFWIIPYRLIIAIIILLLVFVACFILIRRHRAHLTDNRDQEIDTLKRRIVELENKR